MEKVAVTGRKAGCRRKARFAACAPVALCIAAAPAVWAQEAAPAADVLLAQSHPPRSEAPLHLHVQASQLPRLEALDSGFQGPRVDLTLFPGRRSGLGAMVGMSGFTQRDAPRLQPLGVAQPRPGVDLGLHFSQRLQSQQIDVMAWRRMNTEPDAYTLIQQRQPVYGARVEMNLSAVRKSGLGFEGGRLGFQLESGARISIRRKDGRPMIYYRNTF